MIEEKDRQLLQYEDTRSQQEQQLIEQHMKIEELQKALKVQPIVSKRVHFLAELQRSCSRLMFWRKAGGQLSVRTDGRAYVSLSSLTR
jgi:hypothetical protein